MPLSRREFLAVTALGLLSDGANGAARSDVRDNVRPLNRLANGLAYQALHHPTSRRTTLYMVYGSGCRHDPKEAQGTAHMLEHALFRAVNETGQSFDAQFKALGLEGKAFTTEDFTAYHCAAPAHLIPSVLRIEAERMVRMPLSIEALAVEKKVMLAEIASKDEAFMLNQRLTSAVMQGTAYANQLAGVAAHVEQFTVQSLQQFHMQHYAPSNAILILVGPSPVATMEGWIAEAFHSIDKPFTAASTHNQWQHRESRYAPAPVKPSRLALAWPGLRTSETSLGALWDAWTAHVLGPETSSLNLCFEHTGRLVLSTPRNSESVERQAGSLRRQLAHALHGSSDTALQESLNHAVELSMRINRQNPEVRAEQQVGYWQQTRTPAPLRQGSALAQLRLLLQAPSDLFLV